MLPSKTNQLSRNSTADLSLSRNSRGAEHLSRNSRGVEDRSRNSRGGQRSQVSSRASDHTGYTPFACTRGASARSRRNPFLPFELSPFHFSLISIVIISVPYQNWKLKVSHVADSFRFPMLIAASAAAHCGRLIAPPIGFRCPLLASLHLWDV